MAEIITGAGVSIILLSFLMMIFSDNNFFDMCCTILALVGFYFTLLGISKDMEVTNMKINNINPDIIEYITDIRSKEEMNISTNDTVAVYIECKRNGFTDEEIVVFLLPDITEDEARSIVKTYNLLEEEN